MPGRCGAPSGAVPGCFDVWIYVLSRSVRLAAQGVALTGIVAGSVAFASFDKSVDLTVDGRTRAVHSFGASVGEVLASAGVTVGPHDIVSPRASDAVQDGARIVVRYGRKLTVNLDGRTHEYWTTALSVDEALTQLGLRADSARLSVSRSMPLGRTGLQLSMATRKSVLLNVGGKASTRTTYAMTVADLLAQSRVTVGPLDRLSLSPATPLSNGATVVLTRVQRRMQTLKVAVPAPVTRVRSAALAKGTTQVKRSGQSGLANVSYVDTLVNGRRTSRVTTSSTVLAGPVAQVLLVGTGTASVTSADAIPSGGGLNWVALAQCESGGNPRAVNANGHYGLYQFSLQTWAGVGGSGNPIDASVAEQTRRAQILYARSGAGQWSCGAHLYD